MDDDRDVMQQINRLVDEEHELLSRAEASGGLEPAERERLHALQVEVDQRWDLLRQRRGLRHAGVDPDAARMRSASVVEHYKQ
jgi:hypothetical protein